MTIHLKLILIRFGVFPLGDSEILFCHTLLGDFQTLNESVWVATKPSGDSLFINIYVHLVVAISRSQYEI